MPKRASETELEYEFRLRTTLMEAEIEQRLQQIRIEGERFAIELRREGWRMFFAGVGAAAALIAAGAALARLVWLHQ